MSDDVARFGLVAQDGVSAPANQAAAALKKLQASIDADNKALKLLEKMQKNLSKATAPNTKDIAKLDKQIAAIKDRVAGSTQKFINLGGQLSKKQPRLSASDRVKELGEQLGKMPGPLGRVASSMAQWYGRLGSGRMLLLGLAAGIVAVGVAAVVMVNKLVDMAIASQNARRNELLQLETAGKLRSVYSMAFGGAVAKAQDMQKAVDEISGSVSISRSKVAEYAGQLAKLGVSGKNFKAALEAASVAGSVSEEQGNMALNWAAQVARVGGAVDKVAQRYKDKFGGVVQKKMLSLEVQQQKLQESQDALFAGISIEPLLAAKKAFNNLFSQSTASGRVMQRWLGGMLQPFIEGIEQTWRVAKTVILKLLILGAQVENKWLDFRLALRGGAEGMKKFFKEGIGQSKYFLVIFAPVALVLANTVSTIDALIGLFKYLGRVVKVIAEGGDWAALGVSLIDGIKEGVTDRKNIMQGAVTGIGEDMLGDFRSVFDMQSPSKVMEAYGRNITAGLAKGINESRSEPTSAMMSMAPVPDGQRDSAATQLQPRGSITIGELNVTVGAGAQPSDATAIGAAIKRELENILQTVAVQIGAPA